MKPLTIEQLKTLKEGDWIWIILKDEFYSFSGSHKFRSPHDGTYYVIYDREETGLSVLTIFENRTMWVDYSDYGTRWIAYKNKEYAEVKGDILELPCHIGDKIYTVIYFCDHKGCDKLTQSCCCGCKEMIEHERNYEKYIVVECKFNLSLLPRMNTKYFVDRSEAERLCRSLNKPSKMENNTNEEV